MQRKRQFAPAAQGKRQVRILVVVLIVLGVLLIPQVRSAVRLSVRAVGISIARSTGGVGSFFKSIATSVRFKQSLVKENEGLRSRVTELEGRLVERDLLAREVFDLKTALNRGESMHFTLATIITKFPNSLYDTFIIDGGEAAGILVGDIVYAYGQTPIGHVVTVAAKTATVQLYSTPSEKLEARLSPSNIDVTLVGEGGGSFSATVPHDLVIAADTVVTTKDTHTHILAVYKKITSDARDPFQTLLLVSPINIHQLSYVQVAH